MAEIKDDLLKNYQEFTESAERDFQDKRYNPAISSYFKALAIICDYTIYLQRGLLPKNHRERILFLEVHYPEAYKLITPLFKEYTDSYNVRIQKETVQRLKENVEKLKTILQFKS